MKRIRAFVTALLALLILPQLGLADVVLEGFSYPVQSDSTGFDSGGGQIIYRSTTTGSYGTPADTYIATFEEGFLSAAGIADEAGGSLVAFSTRLHSLVWRQAWDSVSAQTPTLSNKRRGPTVGSRPVIRHWTACERFI